MELKNLIRPRLITCNEMFLEKNKSFPSTLYCLPRTSRIKKNFPKRSISNFLGGFLFERELHILNDIEYSRETGTGF